MLEKVAVRAVAGAVASAIGYEKPVEPPAGIHRNGKQKLRSMVWYALITIPLLGFPVIWWVRKRKAGRAWYERHGHNYMMRGGLYVVAPFGVRDDGRISWYTVYFVLMATLLAFVNLMFLLSPLLILLILPGVYDYKTERGLALYAEGYRKAHPEEFAQLRRAKRAGRPLQRGPADSWETVATDWEKVEEYR